MIFWLLACVTEEPEAEPRNLDAAVLEAFSEPAAFDDLVVFAEADDARLEVTFATDPVAETILADEALIFVLPLNFRGWGEAVLRVEDRVYFGLDGRVILEVIPSDPPLVDVFFEGAVLLGDDAAIAIPALNWADVPVE